VSQTPDRWVPPEHVERARRNRRRAEGLAGLAAGLLSFALVALWDDPLKDSRRVLVLVTVILALGASLAVSLAHLRSSGRPHPGDPLDPTARGLLGYARALALAGLAGASVYWFLHLV